jgi:ribosomal protein S18 acetylase RimI-like enzyme
LTVQVTLLVHEQRESVSEAVAEFTCRGKRHADDPTVDLGDRYIKEGVWADFDASAITRTWAAVVEGEIGGYVALAADAVRLSRGEKKEAELDEASFPHYGCTQIVMLAVSAELQERDDVRVGTALVEHAILVAREAGKSIGTRFLAADVNPPAQGFYDRCGFTSLGGASEDLEKKRAKGMVPMVLDLHPRG